MLCCRFTHSLVGFYRPCVGLSALSDLVRLALFPSQLLQIINLNNKAYHSPLPLERGWG